MAPPFGGPEVLDCKIHLDGLEYCTRTYLHRIGFAQQAFCPAVDRLHELLGSTLLVEYVSFKAHGCTGLGKNGLQFFEPGPDPRQLFGVFSD